MSRRGRPPHPDILTPREWEILELLREGLSNVDIAERLDISRDGVKYHVSQILSKLNVESREEAAAWQPTEAPSPGRPWLFAPLVLKAAGATVVVAAVVGTVVLGASVIMSGDADSFVVEPPEGGFPFPTFAPAVDWVPAGDVHPFHYQEALRVIDGVYQPQDSGQPDAEFLMQRGFQEFDRDDANGIRVFGDSGAFADFRDYCADDDFWKFVDYYVLNYDLPPETYALGPEQAAVCPDGSVPYFGQEFITGPTEWSVGYVVGKRGFLAAGQRYEGQIGSRPSVVVLSMSERHSIAMATEFGVIVVESLGMPIEDVLNLAEGITCDWCDPP